MKKKLAAAFLVILAAYTVSLYSEREKEKENLIVRADISANSFEELCVFARLENEIAVSYAELYPNLYVTDTSAKDNITDVIDGKTVYLTFDDGPSRNTKKLLEILEKKGIKATFFVVGENMTETGIECLKECADAGHLIGLHSYSHDYDRIYSSVEAFLEDYNKLFELIVNATGIVPTIYRFPGGSCNKYGKRVIDEIKAEMDRRGFTYYDWNVSAEDSVGTPTAYSIKKNIFNNIENIDMPVVLMHDAAVNELTISLIDDIIDGLIEKGYSFDTLDRRKACQFN